jgi:hypothetical protein
MTETHVHIPPTFLEAQVLAIATTQDAQFNEFRGYLKESHDQFEAGHNKLEAGQHGMSDDLRTMMVQLEGFRMREQGQDDNLTRLNRKVEGNGRPGLEGRMDGLEAWDHQVDGEKDQPSLSSRVPDGVYELTANGETTSCRYEGGHWLAANPEGRSE